MTTSLLKISLMTEAQNMLADQMRKSGISLVLLIIAVAYFYQEIQDLKQDVQKCNERYLTHLETTNVEMTEALKTKQ